MSEKLKTFCPLPWTHISASPSGRGRICCDGYEFLEDDENKHLLWKESKGLNSYFNSKDYKTIRKQMLKGERPKHCFHCFKQEDLGVKSMRLQFIDQYKDDLESMISSTNKDGSIHQAQITYIDMALGNKCNLKCRMCSPWNSYIIAKDWDKLGMSYDKKNAKEIFEDKWYASSNTFNMIKEALPHVRALFTTGGEPMLIEEHLKILEMIVREGYAHQILLRYNSNQTLIPQKIIELWKHFKTVTFNCSVDGYGDLNNYIRYPSKWKKLEKNIYLLDDLSFKNKNIEIYIHSTLQAYNILKIPDLLEYLRTANFKSLNRVPFFIWVRIPKWLSPSALPKRIRDEAADRILKSLDEHEEFFLNYNESHNCWSRERIQILREFCEMIRNADLEGGGEEYFSQFIERTKKYDTIRKQSILKVVPEFKEYFS